MLILGVALGLIAGFLLGGDIFNLLANTRRLRWLALLALGAIVRFGTEAALNAGVGIADTLRLPLFVFAFGLLLAGCWANRREPGFIIAFVGIASNLVPIVVNGGYMPIWLPSLIAAGFTPADVQSQFHTILGPALDLNFLLHAGPLGDVIPIPVPIIQNVASIGDAFLAAGLAFFAFASVIRVPAGRRPAPSAAAATPARPPAARRLAGSAPLPRPVDAASRGQSIRAETGLAPGLAEASLLERSVFLGGTGQGLASPALAPLPGEFETYVPGAHPAGLGSYPRAAGRPVDAPAITARARRQPYIRLALNGPFSALWVGQLISLFGDRVHQVALAFLVLRATNTVLAGPSSSPRPHCRTSSRPVGTFVDRWDHQETMVVATLPRRDCLLIPIAAVTNLALVYPLVFVTAISCSSGRPDGDHPRTVPRTTSLRRTWRWAGTMADAHGYPLAGLSWRSSGPAPLAFWSMPAPMRLALLIAPMAIRRCTGPRRAGEATAGIGRSVQEPREGWHFLATRSSCWRTRSRRPSPTPPRRPRRALWPSTPQVLQRGRWYDRRVCSSRRPSASATSSAASRSGSSGRASRRAGW